MRRPPCRSRRPGSPGLRSVICLCIYPEKQWGFNIYSNLTAPPPSTDRSPGSNPRPLHLLYRSAEPATSGAPLHKDASQDWQGRRQGADRGTAEGGIDPAGRRMRESIYISSTHHSNSEFHEINRACRHASSSTRKASRWCRGSLLLLAARTMC